jgi:uncharacterized phage-associated protein
MDQTRRHPHRTTRPQADPIHDPREVAAWMLERMGLQTMDSAPLSRLVYLADGWHLAIEGRRLCLARPVAADGGPSYEAIHDGGVDLRSTVFTVRRHAFPARLAPRQAEVVDHVVARYGSFSPEAIARLLMWDHGAWTRTYMADDGRNATIATRAIEEEFTLLARIAREEAGR